MNLSNAVYNMTQQNGTTVNTVKFRLKIALVETLYVGKMKCLNY